MLLSKKRDLGDCAYYYSLFSVFNHDDNKKHIFLENVDIEKVEEVKTVLDFAIYYEKADWANIIAFHEKYKLDSKIVAKLYKDSQLYVDEILST